MQQEQDASQSDEQREALHFVSCAVPMQRPSVRMLAPLEIYPSCQARTSPRQRESWVVSLQGCVHRSPSAGMFQLGVPQLALASARQLVSRSGCRSVSLQHRRQKPAGGSYSAGCQRKSRRPAVTQTFHKQAMNCIFAAHFAAQCQAHGHRHEA